MSRVIYCISGLGADEQVFRNLQVDGYRLEYIPWLVPARNESLQAYAARMAASIKEENPVLLGVSFGGMIGIEIARQIQLRKLVIVSSIKSIKELPGWMKLVGKMKLNKLVPVNTYRYTGRIGNNKLGVSTEEERKMVRHYRQHADPVFVDWAINQVVNWRNDWQPDHLLHIHGDHDKMFPVKRIKQIHLINGGTHLMIYNRADEISKCILKELN